MKNFLSYADEYVRQSSWKDLALIKFCLCAMGVMIGLAAPKKLSKALSTFALVVFIATYMPLITKFFRIVRENNKQ